MRNNNTDPTPSPSPTREGSLVAVLTSPTWEGSLAAVLNDGFSAALPSLVGEGLGVGSVSLVI